MSLIVSIFEMQHTDVRDALLREEPWAIFPELLIVFPVEQFLRVKRHTRIG